jgi:hypothetical protein
VSINVRVCVECELLSIVHESINISMNTCIVNTLVHHAFIKNLLRECSCVHDNTVHVMTIIICTHTHEHERYARHVGIVCWIKP